MFHLEEFGKEVKKIRRNLNFTQEEVYQKVYIHPKTIRNIEKGLSLPSIYTLETLSNLYKVDLLEILLKYRKIQTLRLDLILQKTLFAISERNVDSLEEILESLKIKEDEVENKETKKQIQLTISLARYHQTLLNKNRTSAELRKKLLEIDHILRKDLLEKNLLYFLFSFLKAENLYYLDEKTLSKEILDDLYKTLLNLDSPIIPLYHAALTYELTGHEMISVEILDLLFQKVFEREEMKGWLHLVKKREELGLKLYKKSFIQNELLDYFRNY